MISKLQFWTLVAALATYVAKFFYPDLPFTEADILAGVLFLLGLIGVVPSVRGIRNKVGYTVADLFKSLTFWTMVAGLFGFVVRFFAPEFPYSDAVILSVIVWTLTKVGINPELRWAGLMGYEE